MDGGTWLDMIKIGNAIKVTLFDSGKIDPQSYDKSTVVNAKSNHQQFFSLDDEEWFTAFRCAASKYNLKSDHEEVEERHNKNLNPKSISKVSRSLLLVLLDSILFRLTFDIMIRRSEGFTKVIEAKITQAFDSESEDCVNVIDTKITLLHTPKNRSSTKPIIN